MDELVEKYLNQLTNLCRINECERPLYEDEKHEMYRLIKKLAFYYNIEDDPSIYRFLELLFYLF